MGARGSGRGGRYNEKDQEQHLHRRTTSILQVTLKWENNDEIHVLKCAFCCLLLWRWPTHYTAKNRIVMKFWV